MKEENQTNTNDPKIPQQNSSKNLKILLPVILIIIIILGLIISAFLVSDSEECPETCDDFNQCTIDTCSNATEFKCAHQKTTPCAGNGICEVGEYEGSADCPSCDDSDKCTIDSYNQQKLQCEHRKVTPCDGNGICEVREEKTSTDCLSCDDGNKCTADIFDYKNQKCKYQNIIPCDGNGICEAGEEGVSKDCLRCDGGGECATDYQEQKCEDRSVIVPQNINTSKSKFLLYANYFTYNLVKGNKKILKCFFDPAFSDTGISKFIDLSKNFTDYKFTVASSNTSMNRIRYKVLGPDSQSHDVFIYMSEYEDYWYITKIEDNDEILQTKEKSEQCNIKNPDPDGYLLKICKYLVENKETIYPNKAPNDYSIKKIEDGANLEAPDILLIRLDCCGTGDLAYINKETKEVIGFGPGDQ